ncbi:glycosyltransferase family 4 protein [Cellulomonas pakistanensis]|uniref:D-inositol 3-phosphate glycosyltransferase n=1 Tax=Cellulomonas pakistanensis TaxID=992287 RepID=A0A919PFQ3_9CELL|nr:glycosyltransferase family 4 protein [Cellulomonas pakistanensis]GIG37702.1 GDP-mannose-dependent alpha-(1-2)-phosphatidylinositol mannosyltransferase [Cellulomonas pakistanensis]
MLRIGLVIDDGLDKPDGVQQIVLTLGRRLADLGHEVHYVTSSTERTDLPNLHVLGRTVSVRFNGNRLRSPLPARRADVRRLLAEVPFDVLHVTMPYSPLLAGRVVSAASPRTAVVGSFVIYPQDALTRWGIRALGLAERRRLRRFDAISALSEAARESVRAAFGRDEVPIIGGPVELGAPAAGRAGTAGGAAAAGPVRIVFLGRLVERKGPRELLAAVAAMPATARPWTLTLAGRGPLLDDLRERARAAGIADRVDFPGFVAEEDKAALLAGADVVALPSTGGESFGMSVVEALADAGGVVLAGDNPGYRTPMAGLEDQLVDPRDTAAFARTLARWVDDAGARAAVRPRQRAAAERFDADEITDRTLAWYEQAIAARRGAPAPR